MKDQRSLLDYDRALNFGTIGSSTTTTGNIIDLQNLPLGAESATFWIMSGAITDGTYVPNIQESDASDMSGSNNVAETDLIGTYALASFALTDDQVTKTIGYIGNKRYIRLQIVSTVVTTGGLFGADVVYGNLHTVPNPYNG